MEEMKTGQAGSPIEVGWKECIALHVGGRLGMTVGEDEVLGMTMRVSNR